MSMTHKLDATNQSMGRLATKIALILRGKTLPTYQPYLLPHEKVVVTNVDRLRFTGRKLTDKVYYRYSGFPGGIRSRTLEQRFQKDPKRLLRSVVYTMLPQNRLRAKIIKNLDIK